MDSRVQKERERDAVFIRTRDDTADVYPIFFFNFRAR